MKTFALVSYAGAFVLPMQYVEVAERDPQAFARELPANAVCFSYCDTVGLPDFSHNPKQEYVERTNVSPTYFIDGEFLDERGVRALNLPDFYQDNVLWNMGQAGSDARIANTRVEGVFLIARPDAVLISSAA